MMMEMQCQAISYIQSDTDTGGTSCGGDLMEDDEKDRTKRASRNKSEKKRRDQFNVLIKELSTMLQGSIHKMDKSTVLQRTIDFLQKQKGLQLSAQIDACEIRQDWKPSFLSNEEFTQLMLEALDGFVIALSIDGNIIYASDSVSSLLGHLPSDLVDQNILNFLPEQQHAEVFKLLANQMLMTDPVTHDYSNNQNHVEFCCHLSRGSLDSKDPPIYEYVKFVGNFKFHNLVPPSSCNGFESAISRSFRSARKEQICLVATVRLVIPQFLKELCNVEEPCEEFTSRHSLEWKFLFLDHRAPPIIGYLPFEVLGTSGYDYYHVDDLGLLARCHEHLMQCGKGKSCYYRFLTKGQQWIWLQTQYYITFHQWNSKPEFIVCTHTVVSYAEVRAERRQELGLKESTTETLTTPGLKTQNCHMDTRHCESIQEFSTELSRSHPCSVSSPGSFKSSPDALSDTHSTISKTHTEASTPSRSSVNTSLQDKSVQRPHTINTLALMTGQPSPEAPQQLSVPPTKGSIQQPPMAVYPCPVQQGVMHHLKEQLEERTRILQANIKTQQEELHQIKEQLQLVHDSNPQESEPSSFNVSDHQVQGQQPDVTMQNSYLSSKQMQALVESDLHAQQMSSSPQQLLREPRAKSVPIKQQFVKDGQLQRASVQIQSPTNLVAPIFSNPMMFTQAPKGTFPVSLPSDTSRSHSCADYGHDRQLRFSLNQPVHSIMPKRGGNEQPSQNSTTKQQAKYLQEQQMLTALAMQPISCSTVILPSPGSMALQYQGFTQHQSTSISQQLAHHPMPLQQQHHYLQQVLPSGIMQGIQSQPLSLPSAQHMEYLSQHHSRGVQNSAGTLSEMSNIQLPR
ncbi:neuronal PAS domain-containing protein 2-like isoform X1 [Amblyraja radiata]|uniref:neuronal PAS domain-containing protein 2-like isoform X1 n=1 Tax=Amblyraja radiata TaxID=386614 RepID=UPI001403B302|nr:neuronal PAS domain-containing protein 2-like isoform X1 [Amblyraja radiata]